MNVKRIPIKAANASTKECASGQSTYSQGTASESKDTGEGKLGKHLRSAAETASAAKGKA